VRAVDAASALDLQIYKIYKYCMKTVTIEVDSEVFEFLQRKERPFVDSPNDVLRKLLLTKAESKTEGHTMNLSLDSGKVAGGALVPDTDVFVRELVDQQFGRNLVRRSPYRYMFASSEKLIYVQNFNKKAQHLWFRITKSPWDDLQSWKKEAWLCFTNPAEKYAYVIPVKDIQKQITLSRWNRDYLEVNIDPANCRWIELDWNIKSYLKNLN